MKKELGNQSQRGRRAFMLYDAARRAVMTGTCRDALSDDFWNGPSEVNPPMTATRTAAEFVVETHRHDHNPGPLRGLSFLCIPLSAGQDPRLPSTPCLRHSAGGLTDLFEAEVAGGNVTPHQMRARTSPHLIWCYNFERLYEADNTLTIRGKSPEKVLWQLKQPLLFASSTPRRHATPAPCGSHSHLRRGDDIFEAGLRMRPCLKYIGGICGLQIIFFSIFWLSLFWRP